MYSFGTGFWKFNINIKEDIPWVDRWRPISRGALLSILPDVAEDLKRFMWDLFWTHILDIITGEMLKIWYITLYTVISLGEK